MPKLSFSIGFLWPKVLEKFGAADGYIRTNTVVTVSKNRLQSLDNNQFSTKYRGCPIIIRTGTLLPTSKTIAPRVKSQARGQNN